MYNLIKKINKYFKDKKDKIEFEKNLNNFDKEVENIKKQYKVK